MARNLDPVSPGTPTKYTAQVFTCAGEHELKNFLLIRAQLADIIHIGWQEVNQGTRNIVQEHVSALR